MKTFALSAVAAMVLAATASSPVFADAGQPNAQLVSPCPGSSARCVQSRRKAFRCRVVMVQQANGKRRPMKVCN